MKLPSVSQEEQPTAKIRWDVVILPALAFSLFTFLAALVAFIRNGFLPSLGKGLVGEGLTLENFIKVLGDPYYLIAILKTFGMALAVTAGVLLLAYPLSYLIARAQVRISYILMALVTVSAFTNIVVRALGWLLLFSEPGPIYRFLHYLGLVSEPFRLVGSFSGVIIGMAHAYLPFMVLVLVPVIRCIDRGLEEAAAGLGATKWTVLRRIVIPLSLPGVFAGSILIFVLSMEMFTIPAILGGGRVPVMSVLIQQQVGSLLNYPMGAALSFLLLAFVMALLAAAHLVYKERVYRVY